MNEQTQIVEWGTLTDQLGELALYLWNYLAVLSAPWTWIQVGIIAGLLLAAHLAAMPIATRLSRHLKAQNLARPAVHFLLVLAHRTRGILFVLLLWATVAVMRETTWPSRSYLVSVAASLATLWLFLVIVSRAIRSRVLARLLAALAWIVAALHITGSLGQTLELLDAAAVNFGNLRVSVLLLMKTAVTLVVLIWLAQAVSGLVERKMQDVDGVSPTMRVLTTKFVRIILFLLAILMAFQTIGFDLTGLTVFSGAIGVGVGFGLQKVVSNLISGFILLLDKSIKPGDVIEVGDTFGWITSLSARYVSVITRDGREYLIPNEDLITNQVINWSYSDSRVRIELTFGVSYAANPHEVRKLAVAAAGKPARVISDPGPVCHLAGFGDSSLDFVLRFWIDDPAGGVANVRGEVLLALWDTFAEHGIEIPYPHREVIVRQPVRVSAGEGEGLPDRG
ncbi:MAG: mechanosensitive ion channel [Hyphomicrobiales bacterium]